MSALTGRRAILGLGELAKQGEGLVVRAPPSAPSVAARSVTSATVGAGAFSSDRWSHRTA